MKNLLIFSLLIFLQLFALGMSSPQVTYLIIFKQFSWLNKFIFIFYQSSRGYLTDVPQSRTGGNFVNKHGRIRTVPKRRRYQIIVYKPKRRKRVYQRYFYGWKCPIYQYWLYASLFLSWFFILCLKNVWVQTQNKDFTSSTWVYIGLQISLSIYMNGKSAQVGFEPQTSGSVHNCSFH